MADFNKLFASPTEKFVCALGNNFLQNFLANGTLSKGFAILSDKRLYFKGTCYSRIGKKFMKTQEERIVDVKDITGTGFIYKKRLGFLIASIGCLILFGICVFAFIYVGQSASEYKSAFIL